jgi:hypothetical protein
MTPSLPIDQWRAGFIIKSPDHSARSHHQFRHTAQLVMRGKPSGVNNDQQHPVALVRSKR